jgi:tRNA A-37 threonylcarbamoyl transferase component Bud32
MSDLRLVPNDASLPYLARLLDSSYIGERLRALCDGAQALTVSECEIERVKYRPRRACVVGYRLRLRDAVSAAEYERRFALCMYPAGDAQARYENARVEAPSPGVGTGAGSLAVALLEDLHTLVWPFPRDRKLPLLALLADGAWAAGAVLPELARQRWGAAYRVRQNNHTIKSYFPEHTCTVSERMLLTPVYGIGERLWTVFGKMRADDVGAESFANMRALWDSDARRGGLVSYAQPLAYDSAHRLLWQEGIEAATLDSVLADAHSGQQLARVGVAVAALHTTPMACATSLTADDIRANLQRAAEVLSATLGASKHSAPLLAAAARLHAELEPASAGIDFSANATLHGDLHSNNILLNAAEVALIDVDRLRRGPALADLGSLIAELLYRACVTRQVLPVHAVQAIISAYERSVPWLVNRQELAWFTAAALLHERAYRCVGSLKPGRMQALPRLIEVAERVLGGAIALGTPAPAARFAAAQAAGA